MKIMEITELDIQSAREILWESVWLGFLVYAAFAAFGYLPFIYQNKNVKKKVSRNPIARTIKWVWRKTKNKHLSWILDALVHSSFLSFAAFFSYIKGYYYFSFFSAILSVLITATYYFRERRVHEINCIELKSRAKPSRKNAR
ncbi:hypothetical protein [Aquitalea magnusonii]|uniref:hypothetical protein n=1 Tax=Aquitalea magnusonii TaxID=332411 RepID=UPI0011AEB1F8|nr:hypothetical protein [Aquitalea magnusonii]